MGSYVPLVQAFAARVVLFHSAVAAKLGLHPTDLKCLRLLGKEPMSAGALGEQTGLTGAAVTALVDRLERAGYVVRERGRDDRRRVTVRAAPEKLREIDTLYAGQYARMSKLLARYTLEEFSAIASFLEQTTQVLVEETQKLQDSPDALSVGGKSQVTPPARRLPGRRPPR
jgi:DNA-binding MarR family transcriptional regulator